LLVTTFYYASNDAAATISVANQTFQRALDALNTILHLSLLFTPMCLDMSAHREGVEDVVVGMPKATERCCMTQARHVMVWHSFRRVSIESKT
jgi:hypothetical protein